MIIQFNTDKNISGSEKNAAYFSETISEQLTRFDEQITRVEVHLSDENGDKGGLKDKRCMLEARIKNMSPIAVTCDGDTIEEVVSGAIDKLIKSLDSKLGRLSNH